jgi:hypothetical protein
VGFGKRFVNGNLSGVFSNSPVEVAELAEYASSENASFDSTSAFETPVVFGDGLRQFGFQSAHGLEGFADAGAV